MAIDTSQSLYTFGIPIIVLLIFAIYISRSARRIQPSQRGLILRNGRYLRYVDKGLTFMIPFIDQLVKVNITETMTNPESQSIITKDRLPLTVSMVVSYRVKDDKDSVYASQYRVNNYKSQIDTLGHVALRDMIGTMTLEEANQGRDQINKGLQLRLAEQVSPWGIEIVRAEIKDILPPVDIQESMKKILMSENDKKAAINTAEALANKAEGEKQAAIKQAEGLRQKLILESEGERQSLITSAEGKKQSSITIAQGQAQAIQLVNEATNKYFVGNAITLKSLDTIATALRENKVFFVPADKDLTLILNELGQNYIPIKNGKIKDQTIVIDDKVDVTNSGSS
ncbi:MAG: SPFH domain-containing protein [Nitrososphaerales archaeon]